MKLFRILKEISNYFFIKKTIKKNKNTEDWKTKNLRVGYFGIMYTVINLPPEVYESEKQYYQLYVIEQLKPINEYLAALNLQEVVTVKIDDQCNPEAGVYAFGVKYIPLFRELSLSWVIKWTVIFLLLWWAESKFDLIHKIGMGFSWLYNFIHP